MCEEIMIMVSQFGLLLCFRLDAAQHKRGYVLNQINTWRDAINFLFLQQSTIRKNKEEKLQYCVPEKKQKHSCEQKVKKLTKAHKCATINSSNSQLFTFFKFQ